MSGPLTGIQVLDLTWAMAGPFCTQLLGDLGAEIIKVEKPHGGDQTRDWGPFYNGISCYFLSANRNKKSIAIDLKHPAGHELALALATQSDVVIENFRPGTAKRLGLDYEAVIQHNPRVVYCSISGFGPDGPRAQEAAYDIMMQAFAGLMGLTGFPDGPPVRAGLPVADLAAALYAAAAILSALFHREREGTGQKVETSLLQGQVAWLSYYLVGYFANGEIPRPMGSSHHSLTPYGAYKAKDDYFVIAVGNDAQWSRLCGALDAPDLAADPRFATNARRLENRLAMDSRLDEIFRRVAASEIIERVRRAGVPCGPINTVDKVASDPQVQHMDMVQDILDPELPDLKMPGIPIQLNATAGRVRTAPPRLGEHSQEILEQLGVDAAQIAKLRDQGVVYWES